MNLDAVHKLLAERIGLDAASLGPSAVPAAVAARVQVRGAADLETYVTVLARDAEEWQALVEALVVRETWFFRGGFGLFAYLAARASENREDRPFRVLSVPCSSGEEAYSLAIALREMGRSDAACTFEGVDLSRKSIAAAQQGRYGDLSFRQTKPALRARWFRKVESRWELDAAIRGAARFRTGNLVAPDCLAGAEPFDLIFCRNLFIYLQPAARRLALANLDRLLAPNGLLCVGHAEPLDTTDGRFRAEGPAQYFLYRHVRPLASGGGRPPNDSTRSWAATSNEGADAHVSPDRSHQGADAPRSPAADSGLSAARRLADAGRMADAFALCQRLQTQADVSADVFSLLGVLHQSRHDAEEAAHCFEKALYLQPDHAEALLHLLLLRRQQGDAMQADLLQRRLQRAEGKT